MDGNTPICFWKDDPNNYTDPAAKARWVALEADLAVGVCKKPELAGLFQFRLYLHETLKDDPYVEFDPKKKKDVCKCI